MLFGNLAHPELRQNVLDAFVTGGRGRGSDQHFLQLTGSRALGLQGGEVRCLAPVPGGVAVAGQDGKVRIHSRG